MLLIGFVLLVLVIAFGLQATGVPGILRSAAVGAALVGGIGFVAGFFGPMVLMPQSNLGPLIGILFTGPLGVLLGFLGGGVLAWRRHKRVQAMLP